MKFSTSKNSSAALKDDDVLPSCSEFTRYRVLEDIGFKKLKRERNFFLVEREDILERKGWYLAAIGNHRAHNNNKYY